MTEYDTCLQTKPWHTIIISSARKNHIPPYTRCFSNYIVLHMDFIGSTLAQYGYDGSVWVFGFIAVLTFHASSRVATMIDKA